ncbi:HepT-like ribonuclease domain-containing protein [Methanobrevibacter sp.]
MNAKDEKHIKKIIEYCEATARVIEYFGDDFNEYLAMTITKDHVRLTLFKLENTLADCLMSSDQHPDIAWNSLKAMRNIHAHDYENVIEHLVWETMKVELPELKEYLEKLL